MAIELSRTNGADSGDDAANDAPDSTSSEHHPMQENNDATSDTSSVLTEIHDFAVYFDERDGRLFHSHGGLPYPLPVDGPEQQRLNSKHGALYYTLNAHYVGPVQQTLAQDSGSRKRVLDLCTGTGKWVMDMASEYGHVKFTGLDIVPIATRSPLDNAHFEIGDVNAEFRWNASTMDLVHARGVSMAVIDYPQVLREVARVLRSGGLFLSGEVDRHVSFHPTLGRNPAVDTPRAVRFFDVINEVLVRRHHLNEITSRIPTWIEQSGLFTDITVQQHYIPIGDWHNEARLKEAGRAYKDAMERVADSFKPMLHNAGMSEWEVDELNHGFVHEINTVRGMIGVYHTVWARRI